LKTEKAKCPSTLSLPSTLRSSFDIESSLDPEVSGPKGRTKCGTEGQDEMRNRRAARSAKLQFKIED